jgi:hypothetical protein
MTVHGRIARDRRKAARAVFGKNRGLVPHQP